MTTGNEILAVALALMGSAVETERYEERAAAGIDMLLTDLYRLDRALKGEAAAPAAAVPHLSSLEDEVPLADILTRSLMPVGLAAFLLSEEEEKRAAFFEELYRTEREVLIRGFVPGRRHAIRSVYGGL